MSNDLIELQTDSHAGISTLTLNRPNARNALSMAMLEALLDSISGISENPDIKVVILAANGPGYCAGHDLKEMTAHRADSDDGKTYYDTLFATCSKLMMAINQSPKIFIAKVHAPAAAAGCQLAASCDMVYAADKALFGVTGINSGLFCSTPMVALSRSVGPKASMELLTTGGLMSAQDAMSAGLVNQVATVEDLDELTMGIAKSVAAKPADVLALGKKAFYRQLPMPLDAAYAYTSDVIVENMLRPAAKEGISAFLEKRKPDWD